MSTTEDVVAKATEGLADDLKPTEVQEEPKSPEQKEEQKPTAPTEEADDPKKEKDPKDDDGYTAADMEEIEDEKAPTKEVTTSEINTSGLDPEAKYIVENLPYITARVKDGDTVKELQIKSWTQLPDNVEFASKRDELAFMNALTAQENRAVDLQRQYKQTQEQDNVKAFESRENAGIRADIAELQKAGELPKFKADMDSPDFDKDPATQEVQKILDYMNSRNEQYLKEYEQGRPFRHIGFNEAFYMYQRQNPNQSTEQQKEDKERKEVADKFKANRGLTSRELKKPVVRSGTRISQILDRIDAEDW